ncbi:hypothetical protein PNIG_a0499 [Pseudoalteromonas nigrifaciens]|uniref:Capsule polysaccharide biosynthesis protein n=1 Tax=Pseudoalteromonas nigrifaciens TaxID=28109 RepID=A0AAC9UG56_9GAMM|nr:hypothetical protein PNIG_a0499 [Pseudoalteromonas nigrifaciens]
MLPSVVIYLAKKYSVKIIYFEQGPFNTTMIDEMGVNANVSFAPSLNKLTAEQIEKLNNFKTNYKNKQVKKYWYNYKFSTKERLNNLATLFLMYPPKLFLKKTPVDLQIGLSFQSFFVEKIKSKFLFNTANHSEAEVEVLPKKYIGLYLQVPVDAQLIEHSPNYQCFYEMVKDVVDALPSGYALIIREHPQYRNKYDNRIYDLINNNPKIYLGNKVDLNNLLINAEVNILNNSAVGIESLLLGTKVVTLGNSYYSNKGVTFDFYRGAPLSDLLSKAVNAEFNQEVVDSFLYELIFIFLSKGHFQDDSLLFPKFPMALNKIFK